VRFAGAAEPACEQVDSCGTHGRLRLAVSGVRKTFTLSASRILVRAVGRARAIADLRAGQLRFALFGGLDARVGARVSEVLVRNGQRSCQDGVMTRVSLLVSGAGFRGQGRSISATMSGVGDTDDVLRTHCPGPSTADVVAGLALPGPSDSEQPIAGGQIRVRALGRRHLELALSGPGRFAGDGYDGTRSGALRLSLSLISIRAGSYRMRVR
jgi:hypothetical protein